MGFVQYMVYIVNCQYTLYLVHCTNVQWAVNTAACKTKCVDSNPTFAGRLLVLAFIGNEQWVLYIWRSLSNLFMKIWWEEKKLLLLGALSLSYLSFSYISTNTEKHGRKFCCAQFTVHKIYFMLYNHQREV